MIQVIYYRQYNRVTVEGHAGSGPDGHDLVCSAVSALALTLAGNVSYMVWVYTGPALYISFVTSSKPGGGRPVST